MSIRNIYGLSIDSGFMVPAKGMLVSQDKFILAGNDPSDYLPQLPKPLEFFTKSNSFSDIVSYKERLYKFLKDGIIRNNSPKKSYKRSRPKLTVIKPFNFNKKDKD